MQPVRGMQMERENTINASVFIVGAMRWGLRFFERWSLALCMIDPWRAVSMIMPPAGDAEHSNIHHFQPTQ